MCESSCAVARALLVGVLAVVALSGCSRGADVAAVASETGAGRTASPATERAPAPEPLPDGVVAAVDGGLDGGSLYIVWDRTKERIGEPAAFDAATIDELGLRLQPQVGRLTARAQPDPRTFWVVHPPSGADAALHLAVGGRLYPVRTVAADATQVERLPDAAEPLLNRMRPAIETSAGGRADA